MKQSLDLGTLLSDDRAKLRAYKEQIKNVNQLRNFIASLKPGTDLPVLIVRDGRKDTIKV
jgi:hypothetical protein